MYVGFFYARLPVSFLSISLNYRNLKTRLAL
jgi:hypothetical protein